MLYALLTDPTFTVAFKKDEGGATCLFLNNFKNKQKWNKFIIPTQQQMYDCVTKLGKIIQQIYTYLKNMVFYKHH